MEAVDKMMQQASGVTELHMGERRKHSQRQAWTTSERLESLVPSWDMEANRAVTFLRRRRSANSEQLLHHDPRYKRVF